MHMIVYLGYRFLLGWKYCKKSRRTGFSISEYFYIPSDWFDELNFGLFMKSL